MNNNEAVPDIVIVPRDVKEIDPDGVAPKIKVGSKTTGRGNRRGTRMMSAESLGCRKL